VLSEKESGVRSQESESGSDPLLANLITTTEALAALEAEWSALWARCPAATPFQTPEWLLGWWRHFGVQPGWRLWTIALRDTATGRLIGLAPLFVHPGPDGTTRQLSPVGIGITDYLDALLEPAWSGPGAERLLAEIAAGAAEWDICDLEQLPPESPLLGARVPPGVSGEILDGKPCPVLALPGSVAAFEAGLAGWLRRNLRRGRRRLAEAGDFAFERATAATLDEHLDALFRLHGERFRAAEHQGAFGGPEIRAYHREVARGLLARDLLRMYGMRLDGRLVGVWYGLAANGRVYAFQSGFDDALARSSPGTLIVGHAIEEAIREGDREFDFLRGAEAYKYDWGAADRPTRWLRLGAADSAV
jgi:CelD/BcsL family acetyltransferase involved in cellulose biosynthesis